MGIPDFTSTVIEPVTLPYRDEPYLKATFSDPILRGWEAIMIADSLPMDSTTEKASGELCLAPDRLVSLTARYPRIVLAEWNTHRVFSRNSASSRARSVRSTIEDVFVNPHIPLWTRNQKGMGGRYLEGAAAEEATRIHLRARNEAVRSVFALLMGEGILDRFQASEMEEAYPTLLDEYYANSYDSDGNEREAGLSVHKQDFNRYLEPFSFHEVINTSSYWSNFLELRNHDEAQPAIHAIAVLIEELLKASIPEKTWLHLPFIAPDAKPQLGAPYEEVSEVLFRSSSEGAQVSYRDKSRQLQATATAALGTRLLASKHLSPFEHPGIDTKAYLETYGEHAGLPFSEVELRSNLDPAWVQFRNVVAGITR